MTPGLLVLCENYLLSMVVEMCCSAIIISPEMLTSSLMKFVVIMVAD